MTDTRTGRWRLPDWPGLQLRARDVPQLRDEIAAFGAADIGQALVQLDIDEGRIRPEVTAGVAEKMRLATLLANAELYYVTTEMCQLVSTAADKLPLEFELSIDDPPTPSGFIWLNTPRVDYDSEQNEFDIRAFSWVTLSASAMRMAIYIERDATSIQRKLQALNFPPVFPVGSVDLVFSDIGTSMVTGFTTQGSGRDAYAWIKAFWLLSRQPLTEQETILPDRAERRRAAREGHREPPPVRLIRLRRLHGAYAGTGRPGQWYHQWIVRGHWRMQPWGPGRQYRRPVWIAPFVKGPEGAPLLGGEKVYVVDDGGTG